MVVPHIMVGSRSRDASTYFCTEDFSASSAARAALSSAVISAWVRAFALEERDALVVLRTVVKRCGRAMRVRVEISVMVVS